MTTTVRNDNEGNEFYRRTKELMKKKEWAKAKDALKGKWENDELTLPDMLDSDGSLLYVLCDTAPASSTIETEDQRGKMKVMLELVTFILDISVKKYPEMDCIHDACAQDDTQNTPLLRAFNGQYQGCCTELLELLLEFYKEYYKDDLFTKYLLRPNEFGYNVFHYLANGHIPTHLSQNLCQTLTSSSLSNDNILMITDEDMETPLHIAASLNLMDDDATQVSTNAVLKLIAQTCPAGNFLMNAKGWLPIDELIGSLVDLEFHDIQDIVEPMLGSNADDVDEYVEDRMDLKRPLLFCRKRGLLLRYRLEKSFQRNIWYQLDIFLRTAFQYQVSAHQKNNIITMIQTEEAVDDDESFTCVHFAAACPNFPLIALKIAIQKYPAAIEQQTKTSGLIPLHIATIFSSTRYPQSMDGITEQFIDNARPRVELARFNNDRLQKNAKNAPIVKLSEFNIYELHYRRQNPNDDNFDAKIEANYSMIQYMLRFSRNSVNIMTNDGRLPLHLACIYGASFYDIQCLVKMAPDSVSCHDRQTNLFPFMLAAMINNKNEEDEDDNDINCVNVIFYLLLKNPELVRASENTH